MFHFLAIFTLGMYLTFTIATVVTRWCGLTERRLLNLANTGTETLPQKIHSYLAIATIVLTFVTYLLAPGKNVVWVALLTSFLLNHATICWPFSLPSWFKKTLEISAYVAEFAYLIFLALLA